jgi:hypothetical protein
MMDQNDVWGREQSRFPKSSELSQGRDPLVVRRDV